MPLVYKICPRALWREAEAAGRFTGAPVDHADGFIHFSTAAQVAETAARHFAGQDDLLLVSVEDAALGSALFSAAVICGESAAVVATAKTWSWDRWR